MATSPVGRVMEEKTEESNGQSGNDWQPFNPICNTVTFEKSWRGWQPTTPTRLRPTLLIAVGFLELGNAGDFAANVFNMIPVPTYAKVLMALGGTLALIVSACAFRDLQLSYRNIKNLRRERYFLLSEQSGHLEDQVAAQSLQVRIHLNRRELGIEAIDRAGFDLLLGFGAILVGVGTLMAIGGANHKVYLASNLLSGYIGSAPGGIFALINMTWTIHVFIRLHRQTQAATRLLKSETAIRLLHRRILVVRIYTLVNAVTTLFGGIASFVTATMWQGYIVILPCIFSAIFCNYFWRHHLNYERTLLDDGLRRTTIADQVAEIEHLAAMRETLATSRTGRIQKLISDPQALVPVIDFFCKEGLFEGFVLHLLRSSKTRGAIVGPEGHALSVDARDLMEIELKHVSPILQEAAKFVDRSVDVRLRWRQRYLLEALGCALSMEQGGYPEQKGRKRGGNQAEIPEKVAVSPTNGTALSFANELPI